MIVQFLRHQTRVSLSDHFPHVDYDLFRGRVLGTFFPNYIDRTWLTPRWDRAARPAFLSTSEWYLGNAPTAPYPVGVVGGRIWTF